VTLIDNCIYKGLQVYDIDYIKLYNTRWTPKKPQRLTVVVTQHRKQPQLSPTLRHKNVTAFDDTDEYRTLVEVQ